MRAFLAVELGAELPGPGRAAAPEHLTLLFLGEISARDVDTIVAALAPVAARLAPFAFTLEGVGAFPSPDRPRVVWQGIGEGRADLVRLAQAVRGALAPSFGRDEGAFVPHRTLGRVRSARDLDAARELLDGRRPPPPRLRVDVRAFVLKESVLGPGGARHRTVASFPLGGGSPAG